ncbi:hypothetical protein KY084_15265 [Stakelama sp. CBK3Z-3]|uniref:Uncharacterized protein n=1 Tax=Stakelama flava TaxID=2860338 RepID=A0ABS6XPS1_9SPHN|nr:hypothetical protein [Stakelama flava]MBW4332219.1 hypothetical protein [Stakelama flava]
MADHSSKNRLHDPAIKAEIVDLQQQMKDCLARMDELELRAASAHLDLAIHRFAEHYLLQDE